LPTQSFVRTVTYSVTDGTSTWVLRRPPLGHVLPTAHDMAREYRVMSALAPTDVPVPRTLALCDDNAINDAPFYVMELVDGVIYRDGAALAALSADDARRTSEELVDVLAAIHAVDYQAVGLGEFGRPDAEKPTAIAVFVGQRADQYHGVQVDVWVEEGERKAGQHNSGQPGRPRFQWREATRAPCPPRGEHAVDERTAVARDEEDTEHLRRVVAEAAAAHAVAIHALEGAMKLEKTQGGELVIA
jgi:aminoglycoside phosphotransferase (APT) family kinase protein